MVYVVCFLENILLAQPVTSYCPECCLLVEYKIKHELKNIFFQK